MTMESLSLYRTLLYHVNNNCPEELRELFVYKGINVLESSITLTYKIFIAFIAKAQENEDLVLPLVKLIDRLENNEELSIEEVFHTAIVLIKNLFGIIKDVDVGVKLQTLESYLQENQTEQNKEHLLKLMRYLDWFLTQ